MAHRLGMIGGGNMGFAIARGAVEHGVLAAGEIVVAEIDRDRRARVDGLGCDTVAAAVDVVGAEQIMLAVKPQAFADVAASIAPLPDRTVVISIMAGLGSERIRATVGGGVHVIRAMPNTPCQVGAGMTAIALGAGAVAGDDDLACRLFGAIGRTVTLAERDMYAVTAVSGGGPAYVFLLAEMMQAGARAIGLAPEDAALLVDQTILGAARLLTESDAPPAALREAVTSPGGTTAEALRVMLESGWPREMERALAAARDRGIQLDR